jgi:2-C-methyl-D-erythritol 4-phosphate cytidylyltransferase
LNEEIHVVDNPSPNLKVTYPSDLELAARLLNSAMTNANQAAS